MMLRTGFAGGKKLKSKPLVVLGFEKPLTLQVMESGESTTRYRGPACDSVSTWARPEGAQGTGAGHVQRQVPIIVVKGGTLECLVLLSHK